MKDLVKFEFEGKDVRAGVDENGEPFWVGKDVCESLGFKSHNKTLSRLDDDERGGGVTICHPTLGSRELLTINEAGLYTLIFRSNKPEAKKFRRWITHEVLPQLRRTGSYGLPQAAPEMVEVTETILSWRRRCIDMDMRAAVARTRLTWPQYERLYILRKMGLTQAEAGKLYGVSRDTIARLERTCRRLYETTYHLPGHPAPRFGVESPPRRRPAQRQLSLLEGGAR